MPLNTAQQRRAAIAASRKPRAIVLDHAGNSFRFGLVDEVRTWTLDAKKKNQGVNAISIRQCPMCYSCCAIHKKACPQCGHVFVMAPNIREISEVKGKLTKLDKALINKMRQSEVNKARTYEDLVNLGIMRGYSPKWAYLKWISRGGDPADARTT